MQGRLVREIDDHRFYSTAHLTREEAEAVCKDGYSSCLENGAWLNLSHTLGYQEDEHVHVKTFKNACWTERNYDCRNIVCCQAEEVPTFGSQRWVECESSELKGLQYLHTEMGVKFFGFL